MRLGRRATLRLLLGVHVFLVAGAAGSLVLEGAGAPLAGAWFYGMAA